MLSNVEEEKEPYR